MCSRPTVRLGPLVAIAATYGALTLHAQLPQQLEKCVSHPTLAEEIAEAQSRATPLPKIRIGAVTLEGADHLPDSVKLQIAQRLKEAVYHHDSDWIAACQEVVRDALRERGYFFVEVRTKADFLGGDEREELFAVTCQVSEGLLYRLCEIQFVHAQVFPPSELRRCFPLRDGDALNLAAIRRGIEDLTRLYGSRGYINFTASPDMRVDRKNQCISVLIELDEERQFRVGSVEVRGLDRPLSGPTLTTKLAPGQVFNSSLIEDVFRENKSILPAGASPQEDIRITQDPKKDIVAIVFDFMRCP